MAENIRDASLPRIDKTENGQCWEHVSHDAWMIEGKTDEMIGMLERAEKKGQKLKE